MTSYVSLPPVSVAIADDARRFHVHRIYCVGRNYAAHAREMGMDPTREAPFFFMKCVDALEGNDARVPYPPRTSNLHHEIELVVAIGRGGANIAVGDALAHVFGYAVGNDMTRRDLQFAARDKGRPWDTAKSFDHCAQMTAIHPVAKIGHVTKGSIWLEVNGVARQKGDIADLICDVAEVIAELSTYYRLEAGDLIFTGTPEGVGPLLPGDVVRGGVDGVDELRLTIVSA
jgi:fumarylpyruvate hydrolase